MQPQFFLPTESDRKQHCCLLLLLLLLLMGAVLLLFFQKKKNPFRSHEIRNRDKSIKINGTFSITKAENTVKNFRISLSMCVLRHPSLLTQIPLNLQLLLLLLPLFRCVAFYCVSMSSMSKITVLYTFNGKLHSLTHAHHSITSLCDTEHTMENTSKLNSGLRILLLVYIHFIIWSCE